MYSSTFEACVNPVILRESVYKIYSIYAFLPRSRTEMESFSQFLMVHYLFLEDFQFLMY